MKHSEEKKCGESCECNDSKKNFKQTNLTAKEETQKEKTDQDPTRFGDWSVNGRAIDF
jgi:hypothetical protein